MNDSHNRGYNKFFPHFLVCEHHANGRDLQVIRPYQFNDPQHGPIAMDYNEVTDMTSTPRLIWIAIPPFGHYVFGAVIHDHLYRTWMLGRTFRGWRGADRTLWRAMKLCPHHVAAWQRVAIYLGLLAGGWFCYFRFAARAKAWGQSNVPRVGTDAPSA